VVAGPARGACGSYRACHLFPREKVCGDFVEPAGLRILEAMGVREAVQASSPLPITSTRIYFGPRLGFRGAIPYYQAEHGLPPHGFVVPRHILDHHLLERARAVSAKVYDGCAARGIRREDGWIHVDVRGREIDFSLRSRLIVGADGAESLVARSFNLEMADRAHISIAQRAYVEGVSVQDGEATVWFDEDVVPGYGWMFPMSGGRANVGIGILSETSIFDSRAEFLDQTRLSNSRLARHENVLPGAAARTEPTRPQHIELAFTVDKRGWPADANAPPAPTDAARRDGPVKLDWALDACERVCATILNDELTRDKIVHSTGHQNGIGGASCLNARRDGSSQAACMRVLTRRQTPSIACHSI
jgi:FAD binding domain